MNGRKRPSWEEYALQLAWAAAKRSEDPWRQCGAVALRYDNSVAGVGYNGAPPKIEVDWANREERQLYAIHAEANCLTRLTPGECRLLACNYLPCASCLKDQIAKYKIPLVIYEEVYNKNGVEDPGLLFKLADKFNIELRQLHAR